MREERNFFIAFFLTLILFFFIILYLNFPLRTQGREFIIYSGEDLKSISQRLEKEKIISSSELFIIAARYYKKEPKFQPGIYYFPSDLSLKALISFLTKENHNSFLFTIKEGETLKEIEGELLEKGILKRTLKDYLLKDFFEADNCLQEYFKEAENNSLEGFLFPQTYHLPPALKEEETIKIILKNFCQEFLKKDLFKKIVIFQQEFLDNYPNTRGYSPSFYDILKMASILEKEVKTREEKRMVADILWRRLAKGQRLEVDCSICYALFSEFKNCVLKRENYLIESPFNSYLYQGFPPTPISNPSRESIESAVNPLKNEYWFYLSTKEGKIIFSRDYQEHLKNREIYLLDSKNNETK